MPYMFEALWEHQKECNILLMLNPELHLTENVGVALNITGMGYNGAVESKEEADQAWKEVEPAGKPFAI